MSENISKATIQVKRGTRETLSSIIPSSGEPVFASDLGILKIGNGVDSFEDLVSPPSETVIYKVDNHTHQTIYKGQTVFASGITAGGKIITVDKYISDGSIEEIRFLGLARDNISHGEIGEVIHFGYVNSVNLSNSTINPSGTTWQKGDILYADPNTYGGLVNTKPQHSIIAALVLDDGNSGDLFVRPTSFGHLDDNHDVNIVSANSGDGLVYNTNTSSWENKTVVQSDVSNITGNVSGVYNIVVVDSGTYSSITKDPNTIYFVQ